MSGVGLVHLYTGDGKGKTTAAVGLAVRAAGSGMKVLFVQFLKGRQTGERAALKTLGVEVPEAAASDKFIPQMTPAEKARYREEQQAFLRSAAQRMPGFDLLVLDEIIPAVTTGMIELPELLRMLREKPPALEVVLTGREPPRELVELADYVSEIRAVKHPYDKGVPARRGIEF